MKDFHVINHGSLWTVRPVTDAAREWLDENVSGETSWLGPVLCVEHRYIEALAMGWREEGFTDDIG